MTAPALEESDEVLVALAAAGDKSAFETIVARYEGRVYRLACRLTSETDAPDILQDAFLAAYRGLSGFSRIATNAALMHRRARTRRPAESLKAFLPRFDDEGRHAAAALGLEARRNADSSLERLGPELRLAHAQHLDLERAGRVLALEAQPLEGEARSIRSWSACTARRSSDPVSPSVRSVLSRST